MSLVAIIQARMGSTRLPGKAMADIEGRPMLWRVVSRARQSRSLNMVAVATTIAPADDALVNLCQEMETPCFRGSEEDVLDRYYQAAKLFKAKAVVRLTADCPLLDPEVIDLVVDKFLGGGYDFVANGMFKRTFPDGLDTGVFTFEVLDAAWRLAELKSEREHVSPFMQKHPELFRLGEVLNDEDLSYLRWCVDEPRDLEFVRQVYRFFGSRHFGMKELVDLLSQQPELAAINAGIQCNEGFLKSLAKDGPFFGPKEP